MYNVIIYIYLFGVAIASLFNEKVRKMWRGERSAIRTIKEKIDPDAQYVWFHAASLGEFEQGRPLMEQLRRQHPEYKILLTFFSPSGYEVRKNYEGADIICYLPLDTIMNARRFLRTIRPVMAFFIKYEFWYNYLHILKHRNVPVYSVSSIFRHGQVFFRWYGRQYAHVLKCFTHFYVQNDLSRELLAGIGITDVTVVGDTRFDRVLQIKEAAKQLSIVESFKAPRPPKGGEEEDKVFVAGSSWQPDEDIFIPWFKDHPDWRLIIAPHVISEDHLREIEHKLAAAGYTSQRYTKAPSNLPMAPSNLPQLGEATAAESSPSSWRGQGGRPDGRGEALLIDCFGLLSSIYRYATVCYVGGGFGVSIHNTLEAAVWGKPVIFGPENKKFQEAQGLKACGGGLEITSADDFCRIMDDFVSHPQHIIEAGQQAGAYVAKMTGATAHILQHIGL